MAKSRKKSEIRANARDQVARLQITRRNEEPDWRLTFLNALIDGLNITNAAAVAGVKRSRIYSEQFNPAFDRAMQIARHYGDNRIKWVSRPIWPPTPDTVRRHERTFQLICNPPRYELVGDGLWR